MDGDILIQAWQEAYQQVKQTSFFMRDLWTDDFAPWSCLVEKEVLLLPHWLASIFCKEDSPGLVQAATRATLLMMTCVGIADHVAARGSQANSIKATALWNTLLSLADRQLATWLDRSSRFWRYFQLYVEDFYMGLLWEAEQSWDSPDQFKEESFLFLGQRLCLLKIGVAALALRSGREPELEVLSKALDYVAVALVLEKSMKDWKQDLRNQRVTWVTAQLRAHATGTRGTDRWPRSESIAHTEVYGQILGRTYGLCRQFYKEGLTRIAGWPETGLHVFVNQHSQRLEKQTDLAATVW